MTLDVLSPVGAKDREDVLSPVGEKDRERWVVEFLRRARFMFLMQPSATNLTRNNNFPAHTTQVETVQLDETTWRFYRNPKLSMEHPYPVTRIMFIPDKES